MSTQAPAADHVAAPPGRSRAALALCFLGLVLGDCVACPTIAGVDEEARWLLREFGFGCALVVTIAEWLARRDAGTARRGLDLALRSGVRILVGGIAAAFALCVVLCRIDPSAASTRLLPTAIAALAGSLLGALGAALGTLIDDPDPSDPAEAVRPASAAVLCTAGAALVAANLLFAIAGGLAHDGPAWCAPVSSALALALGALGIWAAIPIRKRLAPHRPTPDFGSAPRTAGPAMGPVIAAAARITTDDVTMRLDRHITDDERRAEEFLYVAGAELRGPLEEIAATASAMLGGVRLSAAQQEDVALILAGTGELLGLVEMVIERPSYPSRLVLDLAPVDLAALAHEIVKTQRSLWAGKGLRVTVEAAPDLPRPLGDARRLRRVVMNLFGNAVKFTPVGAVRIALTRDGEEIVLAVDDEGPGIAAEALPRLFGAYEQAGDVDGAAEGTGLGLTICKRIVDAHGGHIVVESTEGQGSSFRVCLPLGGPPSFRPGPMPPPAKPVDA